MELKSCLSCELVVRTLRCFGKSLHIDNPIECLQLLILSKNKQYLFKIKQSDINVEDLTLSLATGHKCEHSYSESFFAS